MLYDRCLVVAEPLNLDLYWLVEATWVSNFKVISSMGSKFPGQSYWWLFGNRKSELTVDVLIVPLVKMVPSMDTEQNETCPCGKYTVSCSTIFGWFHHVSPTFCLCIPRILISPDFTYISHPSCLNHGMIPPTTPPPGGLELSSRRRWCLGAAIPGAERTHGTQQSPGGWWAVFSRIFKMNLPNFPIKIRLEHV